MPKVIKYTNICSKYQRPVYKPLVPKEPRYVSPKAQKLAKERETAEKQSKVLYNTFMDMTEGGTKIPRQLLAKNWRASEAEAAKQPKLFKWKEFLDTIEQRHKKLFSPRLESLSRAMTKK